MNEKTQIITNDIIQSLDALYNLCSDMSERIGAAQNQNVDAGNEDMALLSDNLARLQGEVSAFRKQLADSHQDWEQIKSQLLKRTEDTDQTSGRSLGIQETTCRQSSGLGTDKVPAFEENGRYDESICTDKGGNPQTAVTSGTIPAGTPQAQKPEGNSPPHLYLPRIPVDAVSGRRSRSDTFSFGPQCLAVQAHPQHIGQ